MTTVVNYVLVPFPLSLLGAVRCKLCFRGFATLALFGEHEAAMHAESKS